MFSVGCFYDPFYVRFGNVRAGLAWQTCLPDPEVAGVMFPVQSLQNLACCAGKCSAPGGLLNEQVDER